ncbi:hypothetical protein GQ600_17644 [Phytophthora cactorum]|nr:hypothetical protein GQ600_17644 [Phytophthora cactorum]
MARRLSPISDQSHCEKTHGARRATQCCYKRCGRHLAQGTEPISQTSDGKEDISASARLS